MPTDSKDRAELQPDSIRDFTATGAITAGDVVSLLSDGTVQKTDSSTVENWIGIAKANISNGSAGQIYFKGMVADGLSGLTAGSTYYVNYDGSLTPTESDNTYGVIGRAISTTTMLLTHVRPKIGTLPVQYGASGSDAMFAGGNNLDTVDLKSFASTATAVDHGDLSRPVNYIAAGSDGSQVMVGGGQELSGTPLYPDGVATCELIQFSSNTTATVHGDLSQGRHQLAAGSDGTQVMFGGGYQSSGSMYTNTCDMKQFASTATAVDHGDLNIGRYGLAAGSDATQVLFGGGNPGSLGNLCDMKQFSSTATAVDHGELIYINKPKYFLAAGSDGTQVMFAGGVDNGPYINGCDMKQFSSSATAVDHGDLSVASSSLAGASDGTQAMFSGGNPMFSTGRLCQMKQFASTATAVSGGDLSAYRLHPAAASGN